MSEDDAVKRRGKQLSMDCNVAKFNVNQNEHILYGTLKDNIRGLEAWKDIKTGRKTFTVVCEHCR